MRVAYARPGKIRTHVSLLYLGVVISPLSLAYRTRDAQEQLLPMTELSQEETRQREQYFEKAHMRKLQVILGDNEPEGSQS